MSHSNRVLRESLVKSTKILAGQNVNVVMEGFSPRTSYDPRTKKVNEIVIPMVPDNCPKPLVDAVMGMQDHEAAHVLYSDGKDMANTSRGSTWTYLLNAIEDTRVNHQMASDYPGTHIELKNAYQYLHDNLDAYKPEHIEKMFATNKKEATAGYIGPWLARKMNSDFQSEWYDASPLPKMMKHLDDKLPEELKEALAKCSTSDDSRELVDEVVSFLEEYEQELRKMAENSEKSKGRGDDKEKPKKKDKDKSKEKGDKSDEGESGEGEPEDGDNESEGEGSGENEGEGEDEKESEGKGKGKPKGDKDKEGKGGGDDESDYQPDAKPLNVKDLPGSFDDALGSAIGHNIELEFKKQKGTFFWSDRMNELVTIDDFKGGRYGGNIKSANGLEQFDASCKQVSSYLRKKLERLMESQKRVYYTGGHKSGKLTAKQLFSVPLGNQFVFSKKNDIRAVNACAGLLMDMSGSMGGQKIDLASRCTYTVADCLDKLKIPFEALGFWTDSPNALDRSKVIKSFQEFASGISAETRGKIVNEYALNSTFVFKGFDEPFGLKQKCALMASARGEIGMASNEDATHLRIALERMSRQPKEKRVLFVFSDGQPAFGGNNQYNARTKLKELADNAQSQYGVTVVGIGIMCENVKHFYKNSINISKLDELPNAVFEILSKQLLGK